jgi:hypothetical protein
MPGAAAASGQTDRFSTEFNPAIGLVFDVVGDHVDASGGSTDDGFDLELRAGEVTLSAWIDPSLWGYAAVVYADDEGALEEAALQYVGFEDTNLTLRGGRFFVDFGKQMQAHLHDLRTLERPAVLREYLGDELGGDGVQLDGWFVGGERTVMRYSLGVFASLVEGAHDHGGDDVGGEAEPFDGERKDLDELALTARFTGFTEVGERGTLQLGASARLIPDFGFEADGSAAPGGSVDGLSNTVLGLDCTWGVTDETATRSWTLGGEALFFTGDIGGDVLDNALVGDPADDTVDVVDDDAVGWYAFVDRAWTLRDSAGIQWSWLELPEDGGPELSEVELYYTRQLSDFQRLRVVAAVSDREDGPDATRFALQWTGFVGPHTHGMNW